MRFVTFERIVTFLLCKVDCNHVCYNLFHFYRRFNVAKTYSKVKYLNCEGYSSIRCPQMMGKPIERRANQRVSKIQVNRNEP